MAIAVELKNVSYTYKARAMPSISKVNLTIHNGDFVLITGPTGCGKSTLLKTLNGLIPHESGGLLAGDVLVKGQNTKKFSIAQLSHTVGMMFQCPDDQIFSTTVMDEVAFILENMGMSSRERTERVHEALEMVGLIDKEKESVHALSGGQKQRLALAAVLAAKPQVLALDEPISQLDPQGAADLLSVLKCLNESLGITVILVEHRLHEVMPLCNRVVVMNEGRLVWQGTREEAFQFPDIFTGYGLRVPQTVNICRQLQVPVSTAEVRDAVAALKTQYDVPEMSSDTCASILVPCKRNEPVIQMENVIFRYCKNGSNILDGVSLTVNRGQFVALMGNNGAGKSTLLQHISGLLKPVQGTITVLNKTAAQACRQIGFVMQNPDFMLFNATVRDELYFALRQQPQCSDEQKEYCARLIEKLGLADMQNDFPLALSRGQRLRVAVGAVLSYRPSILLLDEPTTGQDIGHIDEIVRLLKEYTAEGGTVLFCTHDVEVAAKYAERIVVMTKGKIAADASPTQVFTQDKILQSAGLKSPAALKVSQQLYKGSALTVEEVVSYVRQAGLGSNACRYAYSQA